MCRFHTQYPSTGPYSHVSKAAAAWAERLDDEEQEFWDEDWDEDEQILSRAILDCVETTETFNTKVETLKADEMLMSVMLTQHCGDCHPLINVPAGSIYCQPCDCNGTYGHFVSRFRCIPCVLKEETKLVTQQQRFTTEYCYIREGITRYGGVRMPALLRRPLLTSSPDRLLRLRKTVIEKTRLPHVWILQKGERVPR